MDDIKSQYIALRKEYLNATGTGKRNGIFRELSKLTEQYPDIIAEANAEWEVIEKQILEEEKEKATVVRDRLEPILPFLSFAYISKEYFGKSGSWMSQRLNGLIVNGQVTRFSDDEVAKLQEALHDIGQRLLDVNLTASE